MFRFHLDRDIDLLEHAIARKRLLAGLGPTGTRELQFFIAEEGITAAAYVVISVTGESWVLEECGDRDPSGARVGAILQALIARQPAERRPVIRAWLPPNFLPPQVTILSGQPATEWIDVRPLGARRTRLEYRRGMCCIGATIAMSPRPRSPARPRRAIEPIDDRATRRSSAP
jgi:hypothetical protein